MLQKATLSDFPTLYALLEDSFPPDEYRPYEAQFALLSDPRYTLWTTKRKKALISVWQFDRFAYIEHFAVDPACRNQGLGTQLLQEVLSALPCPVCLEAELPDSELTRRRLAFYQRNGFICNVYPYIQPAYSPGRSPVPMQILSTPSALDHAQFRTVQDTLFQIVYKKSGRS